MAPGSMAPSRRWRLASTCSEPGPVQVVAVQVMAFRGRGVRVVAVRRRRKGTIPRGAATNSDLAHRAFYFLFLDSR